MSHPSCTRGVTELILTCNNYNADECVSQGRDGCCSQAQNAASCCTREGQKCNPLPADALQVLSGFSIESAVTGLYAVAQRTVSLFVRRNLFLTSASYIYSAFPPCQISPSSLVTFAKSDEGLSLTSLRNLEHDLPELMASHSQT